MYLFIYGCAGSLLLCGLFSGAANGGSSLVAVQGSSLQWLLFWGTQVSVLAARGLGRCVLSSCGHRLRCPHRMRDPPGPGMDAMSPALARGFFTPEPPGKPWSYSFKKWVSKRNNGASQVAMVILLAFISLITIAGIYWVLAVYHTIICILNTLSNLLCNCTKDMLDIGV